MGGLLSALLYIVVISTLMEKVESYTDIFEFFQKCNQPIKEIHKEESYLVLYAREVLPDNDCRLSFISKDDKVTVCVKTNFFSIMDCRIKLNYHRKFGFIDKSYSCNDSSPQEFCVEKKDTLYISLENASLYTNANIELVVTASIPKHDSKLWLIGVAVGVIIVAFIILSHVCKKKEASVNSETQSQVTPNSSNQNQSGSSNTPKATTQEVVTSETAETIPEQQPQVITIPSVVQQEPTQLPPDEFEVTIQMDQNENNRRQLPTQREAPEYHTVFVSPPPYTERVEQ